MTLYINYLYLQVVARETLGTAASAPLSLSVNLIDVNDNAPKLPMLAPISIPAGESKREVAQVINFIYIHIVIS